MKIDLSTINREQFTLKEGVFCGNPAILVTPAPQGTNWTQENKHLRSSIWSLDGKLLSAGFPRFTNAGENPEHFPMPSELRESDCIIGKIDGSTCICDWDESAKALSMRTRGTFSYETLENKDDFSYCAALYPRIADFVQVNPRHSLIFEITTPNQKIILDYGDKPDLWLIGLISKHDYSLATQSGLDRIAKFTGLKRPPCYSFNSLKECSEAIAATKGIEGVVLYSGEDQQVLHKIKTEEYIKMHRFKSHATLANTIDLFFLYGRPSVTAFHERVRQEYDWECAEMIYEFINQINLAKHCAVSHYNLIAASDFRRF